MMYYSQAVKEIDQGHIEPAYLLFGEEQLLADDLIKRIKLKYLTKPESELNFFLRYGNEECMDEVISLSAGRGLFSARKLIILKEADSLRQEQVERLLNLLRKPHEDICFILHAVIPNLYQSQLKKIEAIVTSVNLLPLRADELKNFIVEEFKKYTQSIQPEAVELLLFMVGNQLADLIMQIQQVAQLVNPHSVIDTDTIQNIVGSYANQNIFEYTRLLGNRELKKAQFVLTNLIESGQNPQQIIFQIIRHFTILWKIKGLNRVGKNQPAQLTKELKGFPKYINEYMEQSKKWRAADLQKIFTYITEADRNLKNNSLEPQIILDILSYKIINSN